MVDRRVVTDPEDKADLRDEAERRIARAREMIGESFAQLSGSGAPTIEASAWRPGSRQPATDPAPASGGPGHGLEDLDRQIAAAGGVEGRLAAWIDSRVRAAERRLELQSGALEAALGEEALQARLVAEQIEREREALQLATEDALRQVDSRGTELSERVATELRERSSISIGEAETRLRSEAGAEARRAADERVAEAERRLLRRIEAAQSDVERQIAAARAELERHVESAFREVERRLDRSARERVADTVAELRSTASRLAHEDVGPDRRGYERSQDEFVVARMREAERALTEARESAEHRVAGGIDAAQQRVAAADRAQQRDEEVRRRINVARAESEQRVREAERRLEAVLEDLERR